MPLADVELTLHGPSLPTEVEAFLSEADSRVARFNEISPAHARGFVPSDFATVYRALRPIAEGQLGPRHSFCEWGSGFGAVASLAAMLEFDACGIEIDRPLFELSVALAKDSGLPTEFVHGSFVPQGGESIAEEVYTSSGGDFFWLETNADNAYDELGLDPDDFDLIFAYPWPGEEDVIYRLFEHFAADGALLLTYVEFYSVRVQRKVAQPAVGVVFR